MRWSRGSLLEVEADLRRVELTGVARERRRLDRPAGRRDRHVLPWRVAAGRRLMRLGARLAGPDAAEHAPTTRRPLPEPTA